MIPGTHKQRHHWCARMGLFAAFLAAIVAVPAASPAQEEGSIWEARTLVKEAGELMKAVRSAQEAGDAEAAQKRATTFHEKLAKSIQLFGEEDARHSDDLDVLTDYAEALRLHGDSDLAAEVMRRAVTLYPSSGLSWLTLAQSYLEMGDAFTAKAQDAFQQALALSLDKHFEVEAHTGLGAMYYGEGLYEFAGGHYQKALELDPENFSARIALAALDTRKGNVLEASNRLDAMGAIPLEHTRQLADQLNAALDTFDRTKRWFPDEAAHHAAYAKLLIRANRVAESRLPLERAVTLDASNYVYWNLLASACRFSGDTQRLRQAYEKSLEANPDQPRVRQMLDELANPSDSGATSTAEQ